ncbi:hypothetical protein E3N88_16211 [Mikania micrantha]|uniref:Uncharacterized protein n=1 Tax=Mikania micrantha TaxID=192012 RepID=A0A5N6NZI3_9ASTR|nr:hypothetical protein E3N88_16211 [Mikania micrantha]
MKVYYRKRKRGETSQIDHIPKFFQLPRTASVSKPRTEFDLPICSFKELEPHNSNDIRSGVSVGCSDMPNATIKGTVGPFSSGSTRRQYKRRKTMTNGSQLLVSDVKLLGQEAHVLHIKEHPRSCKSSFGFPEGDDGVNHHDKLQGKGKHHVEDEIEEDIGVSDDEGDEHLILHLQGFKTSLWCEQLPMLPGYTTICLTLFNSKDFREFGRLEHREQVEASGLVQRPEAILKGEKFALLGEIGSFIINLKPPARGCNNPNNPTTSGPFRRCTKAITLRSASTKKATPSRSGRIILSISAGTVMYIFDFLLMIWPGRPDFGFSS